MFLLNSMSGLLNVDQCGHQHGNACLVKDVMDYLSTLLYESFLK